MKKYLALWLCVAVAAAYAQTPVKKSIPVKKDQSIRMHFDYPNLIKVSTWDKNEVSVEGTVSINGGESDDAFELQLEDLGKTISIQNVIRNMKSLPQRITVHEDGKKIVFRNKSEWRKYQDEHGKTHGNVNMGLDIDIVLEIKVPKDMDTRVESVYGVVEIRDFTGPLNVEATYGAVDAALTEKAVGELIAETNYGNIYSNLDMKVNSSNVREEDFHMYVTANPGTGPRYKFESQYGNVYLRKK
jgi:hypothetical protein